MRLQPKLKHVEAVKLTEEMVLDHTLLPAGISITRAGYHLERRIVYNASFALDQDGQYTVLSLGDWVVSYQEGPKVGFTEEDLFTLFEPLGTTHEELVIPNARGEEAGI